MTNDIHYIKRVEISGLWQKFDIIWELNPDVNILAGINGSGKSTILDYIFGLLSDGKFESSSGMAKKVKVFFDNKKCVFYEYIKVKDSIKNLEEKAKKDPVYKKIISELKEQEGNNYKKIKSIGFERHEISFDDLKIKREDFIDVINMDVISTFDNSLKQSDAVRKLSDDTVETELDWEIYHLQKKYLDYQLNISKKKDLLVENFEDIKTEFEKIKYPQNRFLEIMDNFFSATGKKVNRDKNEISFLLDNQEISPFQLSSGEKQILIILLTVLVQDNKQAILFMDEPEISLHIEWQKKLIQYIRELNPNVQIILATHSPAIIMEGWLDKVFEVSDLIVNKQVV